MFIPMKFFLKLVSALGLLYLIIFSIFFFFNRPKVTPPSQLTLPVATVINPIRGASLGLEKADVLASLKGQWQVTKDAGVSATWLWQYSALDDAKRIEFAKAEMKDQEFGIFLEIDRDFAQKEHVSYPGLSGEPWYFSNKLLLVSYDVLERRKLIDAVFAKFKKTFGYYPKTVGAWWVGADSLQYMHEKYGVIASLQAADQFDLDVYSIWGAPWSIPYVASKENEAIPAASSEKSSHVVIMQWAPRDPTSGYGDAFAHSTYSIQDYAMKNYDSSYADYLFNIFLKKPYDHVVVGLESGFTPDAYAGQYKTHLLKIKGLENQQKVFVKTAGDFAESFLARKDVFGGTRYFLSQGYKSDDQSFWFHSENYRAGIQRKGDEIYLVDLRSYASADGEDFSVLPNSQGYLRINAPALIDSARSPDQKVLLGKSNEQLRVKKENEEIIVTSGEKQIAKFTNSLLVLPTASRTFTFQKANHLTFLFDRKELFLFPLVAFLPFSLTANLLLLKIVPFLVLLLTYFFLRKYIFWVCLLGFALLYSHVPAFIVNEFGAMKKKAVVAGLVIYLLLAAATFLFVFLKKRRYLFKMAAGFFLGFIILAATLFLSWQKYAITPFEMESVQVISDLHKDVIVVAPKERPDYRAVTPLLFEKYRYGEKLTKTHWQQVIRVDKKPLLLTGLRNSVVVVPRYVGAEIFSEEIEKYKLKKIFDNAQIQLFVQ